MNEMDCISPSPPLRFFIEDRVVGLERFHKFFDYKD